MLTLFVLSAACSAVGAMAARDSGKSAVLGAACGALGFPGFLLLSLFLPPGPESPPDEKEW